MEMEKLIINVSTEPFPLHPLAEAFRPWDKAEEEVAVNSLEELGQLDPIEVYAGQVVDGANRQRTLIAKGMPVRWTDITRKIESNKISIEQYVIGKNLSRRHLTSSERAMIAAKILAGAAGAKAIKPGRGRPKKGSDYVDFQSVASTAKVGQTDAKAAMRVLQQGGKELIEKVEKGQISVREAAASLALPNTETQPEQKGLALLRKAEQCIGVLARTLHDANDGTPLKGYESCRSAMNVVAKHIASWQDTLRSTREAIKSTPSRR